MVSGQELWEMRAGCPGYWALASLIHTSGELAGGTLFGLFYGGAPVLTQKNGPSPVLRVSGIGWATGPVGRTML